MKKTITTTYTDEEFRALIRDEIKSAISDGSFNQTDNDTVFLTVKEAAEFLKLATPTIYNHINNKTIPFHKKEGARRVLFLKSELMEWLKAEKK